VTYQRGIFFRDKFSFLFFFFAIKNDGSVNSRYFYIKKSFSYMPGFLSVVFFFFCEKQFDGDIVASPGPRKVESLDLINHSVRMYAHLEENDAWAQK